MERSELWSRQGRIPFASRIERFGAYFLLHLILAKFTPIGIHRWLTDRERRRTVWTVATLFCTSARFQSAYGRHVVGEAIRRWQRQGRLESVEVDLLRRHLASSELDEYVRCFAMHCGLKVFLPVLAPFKFGGIAATFATGNPMYLLPVFVLPAARTAITLWRMLHPSRRHIPYAEALLIGPLPALGTLALPVQMRASHPELSAFLLRKAVARVGRSLPIYGGQDSRVEIWAIKSVNLALEAIDGLSAIAGPLARLFVREPALQVEEPATLPFSRRAGIEGRYIAQLAAAESADVSDAEIAWRDWKTRQAARRAA